MVGIECIDSVAIIIQLILMSILFCVLLDDSIWLSVTVLWAGRFKGELK